MIKTYTADEFRAFCQTNPVEHYDVKTEVVWFAEENGNQRCTDRVSYNNNIEGGPDPVNLVIAATGKEAADELESIRPR